MCLGELAGPCSFHLAGLYRILVVYLSCAQRFGPLLDANQVCDFILHQLVYVALALEKNYGR